VRILMTSMAVVVAASAVATPALSQGICQRLWVERNSIYKDAGYCFKTARAINYFGNAGCRYEVEGALPLSPSERARIMDILAEERANGCR
jgi:hypothetical protein